MPPLPAPSPCHALATPTTPCYHTRTPSFAARADEYHRLMSEPNTIIDARNAYEWRSATSSRRAAPLLDPKMRNSHEFPGINAPETRQKLQDRTPARTRTRTPTPTPTRTPTRSRTLPSPNANLTLTPALAPSPSPSLQGKKVSDVLHGRHVRATALLDQLERSSAAGGDFKTEGVVMVRGGIERYVRPSLRAATGRSSAPSLKPSPTPGPCPGPCPFPCPCPLIFA